MPTISFWNLRNTEEVSVIAEFIDQNGVEILALAEWNSDPNQLVAAYTERTNQTLYHVKPRAGISRVHLFSRFPPETFRFLREEPYVIYVEYTPEVGQSILISATHLPSKLHLSSADQLIEAQLLRRSVEEIETLIKHDRTVLIGDFNMNPFEDGMVASHALHGVMDKRILNRGSRTVLHSNLTFFYNPMWKLMGDSSAEALGTTYLGSGKHIHYFWDTFDQILLRSSLLDYFSENDLRIVDRVGERSLLASNPPGLDNTLSDHLPIVFKLQT